MIPDALAPVAPATARRRAAVSFFGGSVADAGVRACARAPRVAPRRGCGGFFGDLRDLLDRPLLHRGDDVFALGREGVALHESVHDLVLLPRDGHAEHLELVLDLLRLERVHPRADGVGVVGDVEEPQFFCDLRVFPDVVH